MITETIGDKSFHKLLKYKQLIRSSFELSEGSTNKGAYFEHHQYTTGYPIKRHSKRAKCQIHWHQFSNSLRKLGPNFGRQSEPSNRWPFKHLYFQLNFYRFNFPRGQDGKVKDLGSVLQLLDKLLIFRSEVLEINSFESFSDIVQALFDL